MSRSHSTKVAIRRMNRRLRHWNPSICGYFLIAEGSDFRMSGEWPETITDSLPTQPDPTGHGSRGGPS